jgi:hypothetical protein
MTVQAVRINELTGRTRGSEESARRRSGRGGRRSDEAALGGVPFEERSPFGLDGGRVLEPGVICGLNVGRVVCVEEQLVFHVNRSE